MIGSESRFRPQFHRQILVNGAGFIHFPGGPQAIRKGSPRRKLPILLEQRLRDLHRTFGPAGLLKRADPKIEFRRVPEASFEKLLVKRRSLRIAAGPDEESGMPLFEFLMIGKLMTGFLHSAQGAFDPALSHHRVDEVLRHVGVRGIDLDRTPEGA